MTVAELIATLALDFEDQASAKASKAARSLEESLKSINIEGAIKGDPFSRTYKYVNAFRKQFRTLAQDMSSGLDLGISGKKFLPGIKTLIKNIEDVHSHYAEVGVAFGNLNKLIDSSTSLYHKYGKVGVEENDKIQSSLNEVASRMEEVKATLLSVELSPQLDKELRGRVIPSIDRMIEALKLGDDKSKTAFLKAVENLRKLNFSSKAALTGLKQLIQEFDLLNKKTEQFYSTRNIKAVPVEQLGGVYSGILEKLGRARAELSKTLGLIKSEFQYVPRMAESVRNQIISLAKAGYDLSATEVRNIKQVVQYRDIELQALQVKANLLRAGLVSDREAISLIQQASNYAQKYNLSLKEVLNTLNLSTKDWASFYASSIKSKSGLAQIRSELDIINNLIAAGVSGNKAITTEIIANLRARQRELQVEEQIINIENQRISTLANMVRYYELMAEKSRLALSSKMQEDLKGALRVLAEINTQLEGQYNIESNLSKLRQLIASSYAKDLNASKLIEASGLKREQIEQVIATAREQSIRSLQLQYELGLLNEQGQKELKDLLLQQTNLTTEQQVLLGKLNTQLATEKSAYSLLVSEQEKLNTLLASQVEYIRKLRTTGGSKEDIRDAERVLALTKERKQIVDETLRTVRRLGDVSDKLVRDTEKEVAARIESKKVLDSINASKIRSLTTGIRELKTVAELRAREKQILDILKAVSKYLAANGRLTSKWKNNTLVLEKSLGRVRQALKKAETEAGLTQGSIGGATSALSGFFNFRLVGVFMLYRALWELRRAFSDVAKAAIELEDKLKKFQAITLATTDDMDTASTTVLSLSKQYALAATDIADALIKIGQAGYTAQESIKLISSTSALAVATGSDLADTVNLMLSAMQAWGLETSNAADVANIFTSAINSTRLTVDRLNTSFNYITGIAPQLNVTLEETAAILGTMADAGIRASTSGTSMRAMFAELLKPSNRLIDTLRSLGLTIDEVDPQLHTITEILLTLKNAGFSAADAFRAFGRRGASGIAVLVSNAEKVAKLSTSFNNYSRAVSLAAVASESLQARLSIAWNKIRALAAGMIEPITHLIDAISGLRQIDIGFDGGFHVFSKTLGEIVIAAESTKNRVEEIVSSMKKFNDTAGEIRGLEDAGLYVQALTKAYRAGLVPLETYTSLMKEYNRALVDNADVSKTVAKIQGVLNDEVAKNINVEKLRRILQFTDALDKQAKAESKLREEYQKQNKELSKSIENITRIKLMQGVGTSLLEQPIPGGSIAYAISRYLGKDLDEVISDVQKLLGTPLSDEWLKSLKEQNTELTGLTAEASKRLYDFVTVVKYAGPEFAKQFAVSGKSLDDYIESVRNLVDVVGQGGSFDDLLKVDKNNIKELSKYPKLFTRLATNSLESADDLDTLSESMEQLRDKGIASGKVIDDFIDALQDTDTRAKALQTSIQALKKEYSDWDTQIKNTTSNYIKAVKSFQDLNNIATGYALTLERLAKEEELATSNVSNYSEQVKQLAASQKILLDQQKVQQVSNLFNVSELSTATRLQSLETYYQKELELAKGNQQAIVDLNKWRAQEESKIYADLSKAANQYKTVLDQIINSETSALSRLYNELHNINTKLEENSVKFKLSTEDFERAVEEKLNKLQGESKTTAERLSEDAQRVNELINRANTEAGTVTGDVYLREAEQRLNALKSSFLSAKQLSEDEITSFASQIKNMMEELNTLKKQQLEEQKSMVEEQINALKKSLESLTGEMDKAIIAIQKSLEKQGKLEIQDNIDSEIVPKFEKLLKRITNANPRLRLDNNLDEVHGKLQQINADLDRIRAKRNIEIHVTKYIHEKVVHHKATGGYIPGYGGGDVVPAYLEPGEFVIRKEVVREFGVSFFSSLNSGLLLNKYFPKLQLGGLVPNAKPSETVNVNLNIGQKSYPLMGGRDTVLAMLEQLKREDLARV